VCALSIDKRIAMKIKLLGFLLALMVSTSWAQQTQRYYVVVGAFAVRQNADRFVSMTNVKDHPAVSAFNANRNLYYVFVLSSANRQEAYNLMIKLRVETEHKKAWVFAGSLGDAPPVKEPQPQPVVEDKKPVVVEEKPAVVEPKPEEIKPVVEEKPVVQVEPRRDSVAVVKKPAGKAFRFRFLNGAGNEVPGEIQIQESPKDAQYQAFKANEVVYLPAPRNERGAYLITVVAPGYKQKSVNIDYKDPSPSSAGVGPEQEFIIPFDLEPASVGDYIEFNHVGFFKASSILTPESQPELDGLINLMKENPNYRIVIHAHCNGKNTRDITIMGGSQNYFGLDPSNEKRQKATAKDLTMFRAITVKSYFMTQGITESRMKVVAEGGNAMIYPVTSTVSGRNDRIEIEVKKK